MRYSIIIIIILGMMACAGGKQSGLIKSADSVILSGTVNNCPKDSLYIYSFDGVTLQKKYSTFLKPGEGKKKNYTFNLNKMKPGFYFLGFAARNAKPLLLGSEERVRVDGSYKNFSKMAQVFSPLNDVFTNNGKKLGELNGEARRLSTQWQQASMKRDSNKMKEVEKNVILVDNKKRNLLDTLKKSNPFLYQIFGMNTYIGYLENKDKFENEGQYLGENYFQFVDFKQPFWNESAFQIYESFRQYTGSLTNMVKNETFIKYTEAQLLKFAPKSIAHKSALFGTIVGIQKNNKLGFAHFGKSFVDLYGAEHPGMAQKIKKAVSQSKGVPPGTAAPELVGQTPEGSEFKLSDLKGKIVLLDFWASWCGPCRRVNPEMVRLHNKYKDKGFDILGVSLDKKKAQWVNAIEKDKLDWHHISDLGGWNSKLAATYGVSSIPRTFLLDKDGKVIAENLKGPNLEKKIVEALGL